MPNNQLFTQDLALKYVTEAILSIKTKNYYLHIPNSNPNQESAHPMAFHYTPELIYQIYGSSKYQFANNCIEIKAGEFCIIPAKTHHLKHIDKQDNSANLLISIGLQVGSSFIMQTPNKPQVKTPVFTNKIVTSNGIVYLNDIIYWGLQDNAQDIQQNLLINFLKMLKHSLIYPQKYTKVEQCLNIIKSEFYDTDINVHKIAKRIECNPEYLSQSFSKKMGIPINKYITKIRINYAQELLKDYSLSIAEISFASGYVDPSYFIRVFKQYTGQPPHASRL